MSANPLDIFLNTIYRHTPLDTYYATTIIDTGGKTTNHFFKAKDYTKLKDYLEIQKGVNVFVRITPLLAPPVKGRGLAADSAGSSVLWVDCDKYADITIIQAELEQLQFPPTMIVYSGKGIHIYWQLTKFATDLDTIRSANIALGSQISAIDKSAADHCFDLARILRLPGSINYKHSHEPKAYILQHNPERVYDLANFPQSKRDDILPMEITSEAQPLPNDFIERIFTVDKNLYYRLFSVETAIKKSKAAVTNDTLDRSKNDAVCVTRLLALDYSPEQCISIMLDPQLTTSLRYREDHRYDYVMTTINNVYHYWQQSPQRFLTNGKLQFTRIVDHIVQQDETTQEYSFLYTAEMLYRYTDGYFKADGEDYIRKTVRTTVDRKVTIQQLDQIIASIIDVNKLSIKDCNKDSGQYINVQNGMIELETGAIIPHSMHFRSLYQLPVMYAPQVDTTFIDKYIATVLPCDAIPFFWEFIGSTLLRHIYWPKAFLILVGPKDTGKSTLLDFVAYILGEDNVIFHNLHTLAESAYAKGELVGKLANISSDFDSKEIGNVGSIKRLTGTDNTSAERKFKGSISFLNTARLIFSANYYPMMREPDPAFFARTKIIPCAKVFDPMVADINLLATLCQPKNLSAALVRMIEGLQRLLNQKDFSLSYTMQQAHKEYTLLADSVCGFLELCPKIMGAEIRKIDLYAAYVQTCKEANKHPVNRDNFFKRVVDMAQRFNIESKAVNQLDGSKESYYINIKPPERAKLVLLF